MCDFSLLVWSQAPKYLTGSLSCFPLTMMLLIFIFFLSGGVGVLFLFFLLRGGLITRRSVLFQLTSIFILDMKEFTYFSISKKTGFDKVIQIVLSINVRVETLAEIVTFRQDVSSL